MTQAAPPSGARRAILSEIPFGSNLYHACAALRDRYLRRPLGLRQTEDDVRGEDNQIHIAAVADDHVLGTVILKPVSETLVKLRQMVVAEDARGSGLGRDLVLFAEAVARDRGFTDVELSARIVAQGFYEKLGYAAVGEPFSEVNLPHIRMTRPLPH